MRNIKNLENITINYKRKGEIIGCYIHFYTERYTSDDQLKGPGINLHEIRENKINSLLEIPKIKKWISVDKWTDDDGYWNHSEYYEGRNYKVFSILANVRNYNNDNYGHDPKGIPNDASVSYISDIEGWGSDAHSPSYFTLTELIEMNWDKYERVDDFKSTIEEMKKIDENTDNVRCCFFFDN